MSHCIIDISIYINNPDKSRKSSRHWHLYLCVYLSVCVPVLPDSPNFPYRRYDRLPPISQFSIESDSDLSETAELIEEYEVFDPSRPRPKVILVIGKGLEQHTNTAQEWCLTLIPADSRVTRQSSKALFLCERTVSKLCTHLLVFCSSAFSGDIWFPWWACLICQVHQLSSKTVAIPPMIQVSFGCGINLLYLKVQCSLRVLKLTAVCYSLFPCLVFTLDVHENRSYSFPHITVPDPIYVFVSILWPTFKNTKNQKWVGSSCPPFQWKKTNASCVWL